MSVWYDRVISSIEVGIDFAPVLVMIHPCVWKAVESESALP